MDSRRTRKKKKGQGQAGMSAKKWAKLCKSLEQQYGECPGKFAEIWNFSNHVEKCERNAREYALISSVF